MNSIIHLGQWQGFYSYGPEYGEIMHGQETEFRMFIEEYKSDGQFSGRVIDWSGAGADGEIAVINGFIEENFISFTKQYDRYFVIDEYGETETNEELPGHVVIYEGNFDRETMAFYGLWEIVYRLEALGDLQWQEYSSGEWRMSHQD